HTAIVVADTARSLAFYRDALGLQVVGGSENYGEEQAHLNNVRDARLRITTLKAAAGPAVEFLEYLTPRDGRPYPVDARPNELYHWQTTMLSPDAAATHAAARQQAAGLISERLVDLQGASAALVRDPDGHAVQLIGR